MAKEPYDDREFTAEIGIHTPTFLPGLSAKTGFKRAWTAQRGKHYLDSVTTHSKLDTDAIGTQLDEGGEAAELIVIAGERASRSGNEEYRDLLARLVAAALIDNSKIDPISYLLRRITELDPVHLRVLAVIDEGEDRETSLREIQDTNERERARRLHSESHPLVLHGHVQTNNVGEQLSLEYGIIEAVLDDLARVGFTERLGGELRTQSNSAFVSFGGGDFYTDVFWRLAPLGRAAAEIIRSVKSDLQDATLPHAGRDRPEAARPHSE